MKFWRKKTVGYFAAFKRMTEKNFEFLTTDFGFEQVAVKVHLPECAIQYQNQTTGITVAYEWESTLWVDLARLRRTPAGVMEDESYILDSLMLERCPDRYDRKYSSPGQWSDEYIETRLRLYAEILNEYGRDILGGDFSIFPALKQRLAEIIEQQNRELFGGNF